MSARSNAKKLIAQLKSENPDQKKIANLLKEDIDLTYQSPKKRNTVLHYFIEWAAAARNKSNITVYNIIVNFFIKLLKKNNNNLGLDLLNTQEETPLVSSICLGLIEMSEALLEYKPDLKPVFSFIEKEGHHHYLFQKINRKNSLFEIICNNINVDLQEQRDIFQNLETSSSSSATLPDFTEQSTLLDFIKSDNYNEVVEHVRTLIETNKEAAVTAALARNNKPDNFNKKTGNALEQYLEGIKENSIQQTKKELMIQRGPLNMTPLMLAIQNQNIQIVRFIYPFDPDALTVHIDQFGQNAVHWLAKNPAFLLQLYQDNLFDTAKLTNAFFEKTEQADSPFQHFVTLFEQLAEQAKTTGLLPPTVEVIASPLNFSNSSSSSSSHSLPINKKSKKNRKTKLPGLDKTEDFLCKINYRPLTLEELIHNETEINDLLQQHKEGRISLDFHDSLLQFIQKRYPTDKEIANLKKGLESSKKRTVDDSFHEHTRTLFIALLNHIKEKAPYAINFQNGNGDTVLHVALFLEKIKAATLIINSLAEKKQTLLLENKQGESPLAICTDKKLTTLSDQLMALSIRKETLKNEIENQLKPLLANGEYVEFLKIIQSEGPDYFYFFLKYNNCHTDEYPGFKKFISTIFAKMVDKLTQEGEKKLSVYEQNFISSLINMQLTKLSETEVFRLEKKFFRTQAITQYLPDGTDNSSIITIETESDFCKFIGRILEFCNYPQEKVVLPEKNSLFFSANPPSNDQPSPSLTLSLNGSSE